MLLWIKRCGMLVSRLRGWSLIALIVFAGQPLLSWADADSEWFARSQAPGVTAAIRFDTESDVTDHVLLNGRADHVSWQTTGQVSGGGALRFDILKADFADSGDWVTWLSTKEEAQYPNHHKEWYPGETFYVQYRIYIPKYRAETKFLDGGGWKTSIVSRHDGEMCKPWCVGNAYSNQLNEVVINNGANRGMVQGYNRDSNGDYKPWDIAKVTGCSHVDFVWQNMVDNGPQTGTACEQDRKRYGGLYSYTQSNPVDGKADPLTGGFIWYPDEWITIYLSAEVGEYGDTRNTRVNVWAARAGGEYIHLIDRMVNLGGHDGNPHDSIWLMPYNTGQQPDPSRQDTFVLYDELIVSTQPIAAPGGVAPPGPAPVPTPPPVPTPDPDPAPTPDPADTAGPQITSATADAGGITINFNEAVDASSASVVSNYAMDSGVIINSASVTGNGSQVLLNTSALTSGVLYTLTVNNVYDRATSPNVIDENSQASFGYDAPAVIGALNPSNYEWGILAVGEDVYVDRTYTYTDVPQKYRGMEYLRTANNDKFASGAPFLSFGVSEEVTIYATFDQRISSIPTWLQSWEITGDAINISDASTTFDVYKKSFPAGQIELGGNEMGASMYAVLLESESMPGTPSPDPDPGSGSTDDGTDTPDGTGATGSDTQPTAGNATQAATSGGGGGAMGFWMLAMLMFSLVFPGVRKARTHKAL